MEWWLWIAVGLVLAVAELVTPSGFFIIFFGLGAVTVGLLTAFGMAGGTAMQWLLFSVLSIGYVLAFRGRLRSWFAVPTSHEVDSLVGGVAIVQERLLPNVVGRVEVRGSTWTARNSSSVTLDAGQRARITAVDGLTLTIVPE